MAGNENANSTSTWPADVKHAEGPGGEGESDPNGVPPAYTRRLLPAASPAAAQSAASHDDDPEAGPGPGCAGAGAGDAPSPRPNAAVPTAGTDPERPSILKLLYVGVLAIAIPPVFCFLAGLGAGAAVLYGCGRILEAVGRALAFVPEAAYRGWVVGKRADGLLGAVRAGGRRAQEEEEEEEEEEGQVALGDVEGGRGGPISI